MVTKHNTYTNKHNTNTSVTNMFPAILYNKKHDFTVLRLRSHMDIVITELRRRKEILAQWISYFW